MPCMTQRSTNLLCTPQTPPIPVSSPQRHHQSTQEDHPPQDTLATSTRDTAGPTSHPQYHPAPPSPAKPAQNVPHNDVDVPDLQGSWTKLTIIALRDLATPGKGLHEAILDLVLWRASKHTQGQHIWIPPIEWGQALAHDTDTNVTRRATRNL